VNGALGSASPEAGNGCSEGCGEVIYAVAALYALPGIFSHRCGESSIIAEEPDLSGQSLW
jgi:hypothetical protein